MMLNKDNPTPLYYQLAEEIKTRIESNKYDIGDCIPPEPELEREFGVSRVTVRRAIESLVSQGLLVKYPGKGTFVRAVKVTQPLNVITSMTETMLERGIKVETADCQIEERVPPPGIAEALRLKPGEQAVMVYRLRLADGEPIAVMTNYLVPQIGHRLMQTGIKGGSLYRTLEDELGVVLDAAEEVVQAIAADNEHAKRLGIKRGSPLIQVTRTTYDPEGKPIEHVTVLSKANRYQYSVRLAGRPRRT